MQLASTLIDVHQSILFLISSQGHLLVDIFEELLHLFTLRRYQEQILWILLEALVQPDYLIDCQLVSLLKSAFLNDDIAAEWALIGTHAWLLTARRDIGARR